MAPFVVNAKKGISIKMKLVKRLFVKMKINGIILKQSSVKIKCPAPIIVRLFVKINGIIMKQNSVKIKCPASIIV